MYCLYFAIFHVFLWISLLSFSFQSFKFKSSFLLEFAFWVALMSYLQIFRMSISFLIFLYKFSDCFLSAVRKFVFSNYKNFISDPWIFFKYHFITGFSSRKQAAAFKNLTQVENEEVLLSFKGEIDEIDKSEFEKLIITLILL